MARTKRIKRTGGPDASTLMGILIGVVGAALLLAAPFIQTGMSKSLQEMLAAAASSFGGALLGIAVSNIWWARVTRDETNQSLREAVADTFTQDPEFVAQYFREDMIRGFLKNNVQAQIRNETLASAVTNDLLAPFLSQDGARRVRSYMDYTVNLTHCAPGTGAAGGSASPAWRVTEDLCYDGQLPESLAAGSVVAAYVFVESALGRFFEADDCLYRSIAYMPEDLDDAEERTAWAKANLDCRMRIGDTEIELLPAFEVSTRDVQDRAVTFTLPASSAATVAQLVAEARAESPGVAREVRVTVSGLLTLAPDAHSYPAYLVYPTLSPEIEFKIDGPVHQVECSTFYNTASRADVHVDRLDALTDAKHLKVRLASKRWVFPVSGASFSWTDCRPAQSPAAKGGPNA